MKSDGIILASVLGVCALFGVGVSEATTPVVHSVEATVSEQVAQPSADPVGALKKDLATHYPNVVISDDAANALLCGPANFIGQKDCYSGPVKELKKFGKSNVIIDGKPSYVQLASTPAGAVLIK